MDATDMVASTRHAAAAGDERWRAVLARFGEITADLAQRFGGTVVKSTPGHRPQPDSSAEAPRSAGSALSGHREGVTPRHLKNK